MKKWLTDIVYVQDGNYRNRTGTHQLTDRLNRLEEDGWNIEGVDVLEKYYVLIVASKHISEEERQREEEARRAILDDEIRSMIGGGNVTR